MQLFRPNGRSAPRLTSVALYKNRASGDQRITYEDWVRLLARSANTKRTPTAERAVRFSKVFFAVCCLSVMAACGWLVAILLQAV